MNKRVQQIFVFLFIFSVFSLTLQASVTNIFKESKVFKNQSQQSPVTEEEEESHDGDEVADEEVLYLGHYDIGLSPITQTKQFWENYKVYYPSNSVNILLQPPRALN